MNQAQTIQAGFDIENIDNNQLNQITHRVPVIEDEDGNGICGFIIVGKNSSQHQEASTGVRISNIKRASKRNKQVDSSTDDGAALVSRTVAQNEHAVCVAVCVDWWGFNSKGTAIPFDREMTAKMLTKMPQWQTKIQSALDSDSNFMKA